MKETLEMRDRGCEYCTSGREHPSYDDYDGMGAIISKVPKNKHTHKMTIKFREEERYFIIDFCPFCGKRLFPYKDKYFENKDGE